MLYIVFIVAIIVLIDYRRLKRDKQGKRLIIIYFTIMGIGLIIGFFATVQGRYVFLNAIISNALRFMGLGGD